jgi:hypothetical protein
MQELETNRSEAESSTTPSSWSRVLKLMVIVSTLLVVGYVVILLTHDGRIVSREFEAGAARVFLGLVAVSSIGGCVLAVREKTGWWLIAPLLAIGAPIAMVFAISRMGLISFH